MGSVISFGANTFQCNRVFAGGGSRGKACHRFSAKGSILCSIQKVFYILRFQKGYKSRKVIRTESFPVILQKENKIETQHHAPQTNKNTKKKKKQKDGC